MTAKPITSAYTACTRPWCLRRDVHHRAPTECATVEHMAAWMDHIFGDGQ